MASSSKTLYLVDGSNYVFRAYYAIRGLSTSKGFPTNALYGFTQMLLKLMRDEKPDYAAIVFDTPQATFRDELYREYKANREEPPDDLAQQFEFVAPIVRALGLRSLEMPGFEADDIIGTLAHRFASDDLRVVIVSGDKDLMQLVGDHVGMLDTMKERHYGPDDVRDRFGVDPPQVIDVLGLAGDPSDNIPGVPGVGPKTASKLIAQYGSIDGVFSHLGELAPGLREKLHNHRDDARMSRRLVEIVTDAPVDLELHDLMPVPRDEQALHELFEKFEFTRLMAELAPRDVVGNRSYMLVVDDAALRAVCEEVRAAGLVGIHVEATSSDPMTAAVVGIALAWGGRRAAYVPIGHELELGGAQLGEATAMHALRGLVAGGGVRVHAHDAKFIERVLKRRGVEIGTLACDIMIAGYLADPSQASSVEVLAATYLRHDLKPRDVFLGKGARRRRCAEMPLDAVRDFMCDRADAVLELGVVLADRMEREGLGELYRGMEQPLIRVLRDMEDAGITVDADRLRGLSAEFAGRLSELEEDIFAQAGERFNIMSPKQLGFILFEKHKLPGAKKTKTGYSTSQDILEELATSHRLPELIMTYRGLAKLKSTYVDALPAMIDRHTGRIHTTFNQGVAATGRLSSSDPNLQNIPIRKPEGRLIRASFVAPRGSLLVDADYSQIELRVLAHLSGDKALCASFAGGIDVHAATASGIFGVAPGDVTGAQRDVGKTVNFATIYGQGEYGLARQLGIAIDEAAAYIRSYFAAYPRVGAYRDEVLEGARTKGFVETIAGRRRYLPDIISSNGMLRALAERMAFNTVVQGSAADIIKRAMLTIHAGLPRISADARMLVQVHDELLFEVPESDVERVRAFVKREMEHAANLDVALVVDVGVGPDWASAH